MARSILAGLLFCTLLGGLAGCGKDEVTHIDRSHFDRTSKLPMPKDASKKK